MKNQLETLAGLIGINTLEGYLHLELNNLGFKLWVVEVGTGGCTFPAMEVLASGNITHEKNLAKLLQSESLIQDILKAKEFLKKDNPYLYDTVFK